MDDETQVRFDDWPKTGHFWREGDRKPNHASVTPAMILRAIASPNSLVRIQRNGNIAFVKEIVEADMTVRVVLKPNGSLHTAYQDDVAMRGLETEAERERWL